MLAVLILAGAACAAFAWSDPARAQALARPSAPVALAERHAAAAFAAYRAHDYVRAIRLYEQAWAAAPSADILYNIARVYDLGLVDRARAIEHYERYVAHPGALAARIDVARARMRELRAAERASAVQAPMKNVTVNEITREFPLDVAQPGGERSAPVAGLRPIQTAALTLGGMGLVGVGIGVGFGLAAQERSDDWARDCEGNVCTSREGVDAAETAARRATISTAGFAAGGGLLAIAAALWLIDSGDERPSHEQALQVQPFVRSSGGGTSVSGRF